jgi:GNAT superfamily N-acetyltransferase
MKAIPIPIHTPDAPDGLEDSTITLADGRRMRTSLLTYPIEPAEQQRLIRLLRTEWNQTDFDWLQAMNGDYSDALTIRSVVGHIDNVDAGTASVYYAAERPEVSLVGNVVTHPSCRRLQVGRRLTDIVVEASIAAGCRFSYLGTTRSPRCVYLNCGFEWVSGGVMRRIAPGAGDVESEFFADGQPTAIREATWGDLPGLAVLVAQPSETLVWDYPRGILSRSAAPMSRCVSNFPVIWHDVAARGGAMCVLTGGGPSRVLGFGTLTPGMGHGRRHLAVIDIATHDGYRSEAGRMIEWLTKAASRIGIRILQACIASCDQHKVALFSDAGFSPVAVIDKQLVVADRTIGVTIFQREE